MRLCVLPRRLGASRLGGVALSVALLIARPGDAQPVATRDPFLRQTSTSPARAPTRAALVIGISDYRNVPRLENAANDAIEVHNRLQQTEFGYTSRLALDQGRVQLIETLNAFIDGLDEGSFAVVYYAGHGVSRRGESYLLARDTPDLDHGLDLRRDLTVNSIVARASARRATVVLVFDACRNVVPRRHRTRALAVNAAQAEYGSFGTPIGGASRDVFIVYSTAPGTQARDESDDARCTHHSPFACAFLNHVGDARELSDFVSTVTDEVDRSTRGGQRPWSAGSLSRRHSLRPLPPAPTTLPPDSIATPRRIETAQSPPRDRGDEPTVRPPAVTPTELPPRSSRRTLTWIVGSIGVASALVGVGALGVRESQTQSFNDDATCRGTGGTETNPVCQQRLDTISVAESTAVAGFVTGAVLLGTGLMLWLTEPAPTRGPQARRMACVPWLSNTGVTCGTSF